MQDKYLQIEMPNGDLYAVPVMLIVENRAAHYARGDATKLEASKNSTIALFGSDPFEIEDWASNNMDWSDVAHAAVLVKSATNDEDALQEGWVNGEKTLIDAPKAD